ncbi:MAG: GIY-YIG nuclease family protein [Bacteroidia bacterium]|nr:GIY-YIG nuclease family protein [Bacteroidia bacterium]
MFYAYVLFSPTTNKIYIGYTSRNPEERLFAHNNIEKGSYTSKFRPWVLLFWEVFDTKAKALGREKQLKSAAGRRFIREFISNQD